MQPQQKKSAMHEIGNGSMVLIARLEVEAKRTGNKSYSVAAQEIMATLKRLQWELDQSKAA